MTSVAGRIALPGGFRLLRRERVGSTNDELRVITASGAPEGTVLIASEQLAGRGRHGRPWASPPGNLYASLLLRPTCSLAEAAQVSFIAALALAEALERLAPGRAAIALKWPNDVLLDGAKVAGVLLEAHTGADGRCAWLIAGLGVNIESCPPATAYPATCLKAAGLPMIAPEALLALYLEAFSPWLERWRSLGFAPLRAAWLARAHGLNAPVTLKLDRGKLEGRFVDLGEGGALCLEAEDGQRRQVAAGELFFESPA